MAIPTITATDYKSETFLNNIYYQMSRLYLSSFSPQIHQSIYHYYTNFMLITHRRAILFIPIKEKICWCLSIYLVIYYFCTSYKWINIDDDTKFLFGDLGNLIAEDSIAASFSISLLAGFASLMFLIIIYYSLHTLSSLGLRTFLLITQSDDPFIFEQLKHQTKQPISRATILTLKILDKKIHLKQQKFRQIFNRVYCIAQFFHVILNLCIQLFKLSKYLQTKPLRLIFLRIILLQFAYIAFNFMFIYIYSPLMIAGYLLYIGFTSIKVLKIELNQSMNNYRSLIMKKLRLQTKFLQIFLRKIEYELCFNIRVYSRLIIFAEDVQIVLSRLFICALLVTFVASQITMNCLKHLSPDSTVIMIFMYYFLVMDYAIIVLLSFIVSKFNADLNSIRMDLNRIVRWTNEMASIRSKFTTMLFYERLVNQNPFGIKIGVITVLTKAVFIKLLIFYIRFTMLSGKLSNTLNEVNKASFDDGGGSGGGGGGDDGHKIINYHQ
ncbi:hypothetical protein HUG17_6280 [Dermatophagoides farinae]|uniref:Uncharacterized protein n=1 Tax=Dermatophagoides farinae TaxID=6954 RepID=A0A9D4P4R5_DERFA|nr:hypothetical protein HUG17_6280 [Dermatophagoides farinae]